jgi:bifunctional non-homologous end joining protein LigD
MHPAPGIRHHRLVGERQEGTRLPGLLLGLNEDGKLRYAGKVGTGFSMKVQHDLRARLDSLAADKPAVAVPRAEARGAHWVKPQLVAEIAFAEFTADNVVRHASFLGLRGDKKAAEVVAERSRSRSPRPPGTRSRSAIPSGSSSPTRASPKASSPIISARSLR